ncbi:MAG: GreA/GreB family elongation factor [Ginsengibacter sp.]|jgi:regulator of nucleoside diphosphate kinase
MSVTATDNQVILLKKDHAVLNDYVRNLHGMQVNEKENFRRLSEELSKAKIVAEKNFPEDVVRINSVVVIKDVATNKDMTLTIVMPEHADIKQKKVSILAPIGTALIGFRKGREVSWEVPAGKKTFIIMDVDNSNP